MTFSPDIAVIGAGGSTGAAVLASLAASGCRPRIVIRNSAKVRMFGDGATVVTGDLADLASLASALTAVDTVHYIPPVFCDREEDYAANLIAAAQWAGVRRISYHSVLHAPTPAMPHHRRKALVELMLRESPLQWTILQPAMYMRTPLVFFDRAHNVLAPPFNPSRRFNPVALRDVGEATARILLEPGHEFATYELAGREQLNFHEMGSIIGEVTGCRIDVRASDAASHIPVTAAARGFDERQAGELLAMCRHYDVHGLVGNGKVLTMLLRRDPTLFMDAAQEALAPA